MKETFKADFEKALEAITNAQREANVIAKNVLEAMPTDTSIEVVDGELYANSNLYVDLCAIYEIVKEKDGFVYVRNEYDECIDIHELDDTYYNDVILYIINHI